MLMVCLKYSVFEVFSYLFEATKHINLYSVFENILMKFLMHKGRSNGIDPLMCSQS